MKVLLGKYQKSGERKISVRIDDYDTWNADATLAHVILPLLKRFKELSTSAPMVDDDDVPENLRSSVSPPAKDHDPDLDENYFARWNWVLDEMIFAFESYFNDYESQFYSGEADYKFKDTGDGYSEMYHGENHTLTVDRDGLTAYESRINNGLRLFGKYYKGLWT